MVLLLHERVRLPPQNTLNLALKLLNGGTFGYKRTSATSIMSSKCSHTLLGKYKKCLYHSGMALVLILHELVRLPSQNNQHLVLKSVKRRYV